MESHWYVVGVERQQGRGYYHVKAYDRTRATEAALADLKEVGASGRSAHDLGWIYSGLTTDWHDASADAKAMGWKLDATG